MKTLALLVAFAGTATAAPIATIVADKATEALPAGLGVSKVFLPASLAKLDVDPAKVAIELPRDVRVGRVSFKVTVRGKTTFVPVTIGKLVDVAVAAHPLAVGDVISDGDFEASERAVDGVAAAKPASLVGATVTREIADGGVIAAAAVAMPRPLARGTQVSVEIRRGSLKIRGVATLEAAARSGEPASARLAHTRTIVRGTLRAGTLVVGEL
ncbi:MAG: flagellar basal body P-ring formation chaperone FlgA [Kofleriaceae bacterium]